jgi:hypothetical protein
MEHGFNTDVIPYFFSGSSFGIWNLEFGISYFMGWAFHRGELEAARGERPFRERRRA